MMQDAIFVLVSSREKDFCSLCFVFPSTCNPGNKKQEMTFGNSFDVMIYYYKYNIIFVTQNNKVVTSQENNITLIGPCNQAPVDPVAVRVAAGRGGGHAVLT